nr:hypothetical protein [Tanacetum cinerariifolium]
EFSGVPGLVPNLDKSLMFFGNVLDHFKSAILHILLLALGVLPVWYVGILLVSFRLSKSVDYEIEQLMRGFLWSHGDLCKGHAKVNWKDVCCLKCQGGLAIKSLNTWNISLIFKHIWNVVSKKDSLWVKLKILQCRELIRDHVVYRIGGGS